MDKIQKVLDLVFKRDGGTGGTGRLPKKNGRFPCLYPRGPGGSAPWVGGATAPPGCVIAGAAAARAMFGYDDFALMKKGDQMRLSACLKRLGFRRQRRRIDGERGYWWERTKR